MTDCQNCDGLGLCLNCRHVGGCGECSYTGACPVCQGGNTQAAQTEANRTGRVQFVVSEGRRFRIVDADQYTPRCVDSRYLPPIWFAAWPVRWEYRGGRYE